MIGVLNMYKLPGMSSHDMVHKVRRITGISRVGHTGTLDPVACGVLPICVGFATRLADYIAAVPKSYRAEFQFGLTTDSGDAEGVVTARRDVGGLTEAEILAQLPRFIGAIQQRPPARSAVWIDGTRAYHLARAGQDVEMPAREITVYAFTPVRFIPGPQPRWLADITCAKGTYIRSLAVDLGEALGTGGALSFLSRTSVGNCTIADTITIEELTALKTADRLHEALLTPDVPLVHLPAVTLPADVQGYHRGMTMPMSLPSGLYRVYLRDHFRGLGRVEEGIFRPIVNLIPEE